MHRPQDRPPQIGLTMIELMIVIAIIGILAALTGPNIQALLYRNRLSEAARAVAKTMDEVRLTAISQQRRFCVTFAPDPNHGNGDGNDYMFAINVQTEVNPMGSVWIDTPETQLLNLFNTSGGSVGDARFEGVSLENNLGVVTAVDNCGGLLFNSQGYLSNQAGDFQAAGAGTYYLLTLRQKKFPDPEEQRAIWIYRAGTAHITSAPNVAP